MPPGMKHDQPDLPQRFGENAEILTERLRKIDWRFLGKAYFILLALVLLTAFLVIVVVRAAFHVF